MMAKQSAKRNEVDVFCELWVAHCIKGDLVREKRFHDGRGWRFDICWPSQKIAVEIDGLGFGHQSIKGRNSDNDKNNVATALGWRVFRFSTAQLNSDEKRLDAVNFVWNFMTGDPDV